MNITFEIDQMEHYLKNEGVLYLLGPNQGGKTYFLNYIRDGFAGKKKNFSVDGLKVSKGLYNVIYYDDTTDFNSEFKFTKTNLFRDLIYSSVLSNVNETKLLKEVNELFDRIDDKVNKYLDINVNKKQDEKVNFDIEITDVNEIIDKFTNIYVDNYLIKDSSIPRSVKRKLIYNLLLLELNKSELTNNIVFIDNFDLYLDYENTKKVINKINEYHIKNPNTYFFLTSSNNIYELISNKESIYKVSNSIFHINNLYNVVENCYMRYIYLNNKCSEDYDEYLNNNLLLYQNDIDMKYNEILSLVQNEIGKLYVSNRVRLVNKYDPKYVDITIYCKDKFYQLFYESIYNLLSNKS